MPDRDSPDGFVDRLEDLADRCRETPLTVPIVEYLYASDEQWLRMLVDLYRTHKDLTLSMVTALKRERRLGIRFLPVVVVPVLALTGWVLMDLAIDQLLGIREYLHMGSFGLTVALLIYVQGKSSS